MASTPRHTAPVWMDLLASIGDEPFAAQDRYGLQQFGLKDVVCFCV